MIEVSSEQSTNQFYTYYYAYIGLLPPLLLLCCGSSLHLIPVFSFSSFKHDLFLICTLAVLSHVQPRFTYNPMVHIIHENYGHARSQGGRHCVALNPALSSLYIVRVVIGLPAYCLASAHRCCQQGAVHRIAFVFVGLSLNTLPEACPKFEQ